MMELILRRVKILRCDTVEVGDTPRRSCRKGCPPIDLTTPAISPSRDGWARRPGRLTGTGERPTRIAPYAPKLLDVVSPEYGGQPHNHSVRWTR